MRRNLTRSRITPEQELRIQGCFSTNSRLFFRDTRDTKIPGNLAPCIDYGESADGIDGALVHTFFRFAPKSQKMRVFVGGPKTGSNPSATTNDNLTSLESDLQNRISGHSLAHDAVNCSVPGHNEASQNLTKSSTVSRPPGIEGRLRCRRCDFRSKG